MSRDRRPVSSDPARLFSEAALVAVAALWGLTFVQVKDAVSTFPVMTFLAWRFLPACALVAVIFAPRIARLPRRGWVAGAWMGLWLTGGYVFQTLGLRLTSASHTGFITGLFVVLTPVFAMFLGVRPERRVLVAAVVAAMGLGLLSSGGGTSSVAGDALVLLCACSFAAHILATGRAAREFDVGALLAVQLGVCGLFTVAVAAASGDLGVPDRSEVWVALAVTSLGATALAFFIQTFAQRFASPERTALLLASEPAFAGLFAYLLADERLAAAGWIGAALIMGAIVWVEGAPLWRRRARVA